MINLRLWNKSIPFPKEGPYEAPPFVFWGMVLPTGYPEGPSTSI